MKTIEDKIDEREKEIQTLYSQVTPLNSGELSAKVEVIRKEINKLADDRKQQISRAYEFLTNTVETVVNIDLKEICRRVLMDGQFYNCTAAAKRHQAYKGGLVVHTAEVLEVALNMAKSKCLEINTDILITAIIIHDYGKIHDYCPANPEQTGKDKARFGYTEHNKLIRHLPRSYAVFMQWADGKLDDKLQVQISHCILSHHGRQEWGSPVEPITPEAYVIHFADMISANCTKDYYAD